MEHAERHELRPLLGGLGATCSSPYTSAAAAAAVPLSAGERPAPIHQQPAPPLLLLLPQGEFFPSLHAPLCTYMGRCGADAASRRGLHLFELFTPPQAALQQQAQRWQAQQAAQQDGTQQHASDGSPPAEALPRVQWPQWMDDAVRCFSDHAKTYIGDAAIAGSLVRVRRALVGVGPACRAHQFCDGNPA